MSAGRYMRDVRLHAVNTPATTGSMRDIAIQTKALAQHFSRNNHCWKWWLTRATAPVASIVNDATDYEFLMPGNQTPNMEIPYQIGADATSIRVVCIVAMPAVLPMAALRVKVRTQTLITAVTTSTSAAVPVSPTASPIQTMGWQPHDGNQNVFGVAAVDITPADLGTSRLQAVGAFARWDVENDNVLESTGADALAMDVSVYMAGIGIWDTNQTPLDSLGLL